MRITLLGAVLIALSVICFVWSLARGSEILFTIAGICLAVLLNDFWYLSAVDAESINLVRRVECRYVRELEVFNVVVEVENRSSLSIPRVEVIDILPPTIEALERGPAVSIRLPKGYRAVSMYRARALSPGEHVLKDMTVCIYGAALTMCRCFSRSSEARIVAVPLSVDLSVEVRSVSKLVGMVKGLSSYGMYDIEGFRNYEPGDDPRKIVWRVLARERRMVVRVDRGESVAKVLLVTVVKRYAWIVGVRANTLAHRVLRLAHSVVEALSVPGVSLDLALLVSGAPKIVEGVSLDREKLYRCYSWVSYLEGFRGSATQLLEYLRLRGLSPETYDYVILVTDLYTLANEVDYFLELLSRFRRGVVVVVSASDSVEVDHVSLVRYCGRLLEKLGLGFEVVDKGLEVALG